MDQLESDAKAVTSCLGYLFTQIALTTNDVDLRDLAEKEFGHVRESLDRLQQRFFPR